MAKASHKEGTAGKTCPEVSWKNREPARLVKTWWVGPAQKAKQNKTRKVIHSILHRFCRSIMHSQPSAQPRNCSAIHAFRCSCPQATFPAIWLIVSHTLSLCSKRLPPRALWALGTPGISRNWQSKVFIAWSNPSNKTACNTILGSVGVITLWNPNGSLSMMPLLSLFMPLHTSRAKVSQGSWCNTPISRWKIGSPYPRLGVSALASCLGLYSARRTAE